MRTESDERQVVSNKRRKTTGRRRAACQTCALRKVRCSNERPVCSQCQSTDSQCTYDSSVDDSLTLDRAVHILSSQINDLTQQVTGIARLLPVHPATSLSEAHNVSTNSVHARLDTQEGGQNAQPFKDFAHIPPHKTTADEVLLWPIFDHAYPSNYLIAHWLGGQHSSTTVDEQVLDDVEVVPYSSDAPPLDEHKIPSLVNCFLENVHTKNPILDVETLVRKSRECAIRGLSWNGYSCMLLLACALGTIAKPFGSEHGAIDTEIPIEQARLLAAPWMDKQRADNCFILATRRLGALKPSVLAAHCHFFAGVYLMYTLRPMLAWQYFHQASTVFQLYLKTSGKLTEEKVIILQTCTPDSSSTSHRLTHLEQRLFWSTFKSEAEFRVELPLPQSEIAEYDFSCLFPSPPSPIFPPEIGRTIDSPTRASSPAMTVSTFSEEDQDQVRQHSKRLCNEEESWYYYLTEIALRRIGNRVINTFFRQDKMDWLNIDQYLDMAIEYEAQMTTWQTNLPPAMQRYETASTIRAPRALSPGGAEAGFVSQELSWATENRLLEMRSWLYQPFLYYLVHVKPATPTHLVSLVEAPEFSSNLDSDRERVFWNLVLRAINCNLAILDTRSLPHRHHGLWFDLRAIICSSLLLLAVVKAGYLHLIPGGKAALLGANMTELLEGGVASNLRERSCIAGRLGRVLRQLEIWMQESGDMIKASELLRNLAKDILM